MNNIIYGLYCPIRNKPVYVGMSTKGIDRPMEHIKDNSHNIKVKEWVTSLKHQTLSPTVVILEHSIDESILGQQERYWVQKFISEGNVLLNQTLITPKSFTVNKPIDPTDKLNEVRSFIKIQRKMAKLTQKECSKNAGIGIRCLREIEQGTKTNFNVDIILKLLNMFGGSLIVV